MDSVRPYISDGAQETLRARRTRDASIFRHVITLPAIPTRREEVNWPCKCVQPSPHCQLRGELSIAAGVLVKAATLSFCMLETVLPDTIGDFDSKRTLEADFVILVCAFDARVAG